MRMSTGVFLQIQVTSFPFLNPKPGRTFETLVTWAQDSAAYKEHMDFNTGAFWKFVKRKQFEQEPSRATQAFDSSAARHQVLHTRRRFNMWQQTYPASMNYPEHDACSSMTDFLVGCTWGGDQHEVDTQPQA